MRTGEQIVYLAQLKGLSRHEAVSRAKKWFTKLEMESWWNRKVEDLSKGMGQKLQFVATVLHEPSLIILDEPFSGLDPVNSNLIKEEIFDLAKKGSSIIFSTHRMEQVEEICEHIILMNKGKKILDGSVKDIKQQFKENLFAIHLEYIPDEPEANTFEIIAKGESRLIVRIKDGFRPNDVLVHYLQKNITITGFYEMLPSMNDIFIRLVEGTPFSRQFEKLTA
jgi:ABC-2 type transport system ATP-binding protein